MTILSINHLSARHGLLQAVHDFNLKLVEGETVALVGANGAGKTTLLRTIAGAHPAFSGTISLNGIDITHLKAHSRVSAGLALVPEGRRLFPEMTVDENLLVAGANARPGQWNLETVYKAFPQLVSKKTTLASFLSGGEQQATAIGRALMTNPSVLLLDEVSLGLSPIAVDGVYKSIEHLIKTGTTILLVEQNLDRAMAVSKRVVCMLEGNIELIENTANVSRERITEAYFGMRRASRQEGVSS